jgi:hypothetical protein
MKKTISFLAFLVLSTLVVRVGFCQSPPGIPYQAIARTTTGEPYASGSLQARFSLHEQTATGTVSYAETHSLQTDAFGLFSTTFGAGAPITGTFAAINWGLTTKYLQVEIDLGNGWIDMGTQQLMSVPYAMYAGEAASVRNSNQSSSNNGCYICPSMISNASDYTMSVQSASAYCSALNEGGYTDWRLASLNEFEYLRDIVNVSAPAFDCWTKDYTIVGDVTYVTLAGSIYMSTNRNVMIGGSLRAVCIR